MKLTLDERVLKYRPKLNPELLESLTKKQKRFLADIRHYVGARQTYSVDNKGVLYIKDVFQKNRIVTNSIGRNGKTVEVSEATENKLTVKNFLKKIIHEYLTDGSDTIFKMNKDGSRGALLPSER